MSQHLWEGGREGGGEDGRAGSRDCLYKKGGGRAGCRGLSQQTVHGLAPS